MNIKRILLSIIAIGVLLGGGAFLGVHIVQQQTGEVKSAHIQVVTDRQVTPSRPAVPAKISIPAINVDIPVESVGLDQKGNMDVPVHAMDAGWYDLGFRPGEKGSAVMAGHLDTVTGAPAAFWNLSKLQPGDAITVTDINGKTYTFKVIETGTYPYSNFPLDRVFNTTDKPRLNLITCAGIWDQTNKNYSNRTVIYSELER